MRIARGALHVILRWSGEKAMRTGRSRRARYDLMESWCAEHDIENLFVAHTEDDQAETFLFRLSRGSGPDWVGGDASGVLSRPGADHPAASDNRSTTPFDKTQDRIGWKTPATPTAVMPGCAFAIVWQSWMLTAFRRVYYRAARIFGHARRT